MKIWKQNMENRTYCAKSLESAKVSLFPTIWKKEGLVFQDHVLNIFQKLCIFIDIFKWNSFMQ